jgi:hypothetical protein
MEVDFWILYECRHKPHNNQKDPIYEKKNLKNLILTRELSIAREHNAVF